MGDRDRAICITLEIEFFFNHVSDLDVWHQDLTRSARRKTTIYCTCIALLNFAIAHYSTIYFQLESPNIELAGHILFCKMDILIVIITVGRVISSNGA